MRIEVDPTLPEDMAEALDGQGVLIARFAPALEDAPAGTVVLRISSGALSRLMAALDETRRRTSRLEVPKTGLAALSLTLGRPGE